ncbi:MULTISPECIES: peptidoglycan D,D-transpeptidase FtsI family protein [unclassified Frondihabitans]|uniref:peptidoglycan D,D-transpeptidase FtsI family protein n=1 Tax=unclassified Frondihabitans TaxID=2626248 RepID=UPI000A07923F|nr:MULTISPECIES: penicillin-binding protein 2 [unclassified Frondihabitans]RPE74922.1 cell division protein FtsI (penicillin-binding protein 3) [Frondihabitans sp. PhB153]RPF04166.1 cell division protein FtsI (penicillin-binding protein 3) [Frondihabitans sp. PhB161]
MRSARPTPATRHRRHRTTIAAIVIFALVAVFVVRLVDIQVVQASTLNKQSLGKRSVPTILYGDRGSIVDTNGKVLAKTVVRYDITAVPAYAQKGYKTTVGGKSVTYTLSQTADQIAAATGAKASDIVKALTADKKSVYAKLVGSVDVDAYEKIQKLGISWIYPKRTTARTYPNGAVAGNLTGFMGTDGAQAGLELEYNKCLAGTNGSETYERGLDNVKLPGSTVTTKKAVDGGVLETTIDEYLQYQVQQDLAEQVKAIGATSGTAIVMKVSDGSLLAVADSDSVDPNNVDGSSTSNLGSKAFTDSYEPGSTVKSLIAAAAIDQGVATPATQETVPYSRTFPWGGRIADAEFHDTEQLTLAGILANSSNVGITQVGERLSKQTRYDYLKKFGFGSKSEVKFNGESVGQLGTPSSWDSQTNINSMFGQGIGTSAIQIASAYQTLANGGVRMPVTLVKGCKQSDGTVTDTPSAKGTRVVSEKAANDVVDMLENTIPEGTLAGMTPISGYNVAAKTGTAQIADAPGGGYGSDYIISVAGIAPAENPQYVVLVTFTKPTTLKTSFAAAPAFREIMSQVLENYRVKPSTTPATNLPDTW